MTGAQANSGERGDGDGLVLREAALQALERAVYPEFLGAAERQPILDRVGGDGRFAARLVTGPTASLPGHVRLAPVPAHLWQRGSRPDVRHVLLAVALGDVAKGGRDPPAYFLGELGYKMISDVQDRFAAVERLD